MIGKTILALLIAVILLGGPVAMLIWSRRRREFRIRQWCDDNGYALLSLKAGGTMSGFQAPPGLIGGGVLITIQDEQGGQRTGWVYFGASQSLLPWGKLQVRWL